MKRIFILLVLMAWAIAACSGEASSEPPPDFDEMLDVELDLNEPAAWAFVPEGEFLMDQHDHEEKITYDYEIMVTDVTNAQYATYLNEALADEESAVKIVEDEVVGYYPGDEFHEYRHEERIDAGDWLHIALDEDGLRLEFDGTEFQVKHGYDNHPMVQVTWFGARAFCEFYGWRLPSEKEWEKAARGTDGRAYPWGNEIERNNANYYSSHDLFEKIAGGAGETTPVGFYNGKTYTEDGDEYETLDSKSPYGLYDMAGNVWQWMGDDYEDQHYRYMRGGSKADYEYNLRVWTRNSASPEYYSPNVGFRCARDAMPPQEPDETTN